MICQRFDAENNESAFLVFHIFDVEADPAAVLPLASPVHLGFHAVFHPEGVERTEAGPSDQQPELHQRQQLATLLKQQSGLPPHSGYRVPWIQASSR